LRKAVQIILINPLEFQYFWLSCKSKFKSFFLFSYPFLGCHDQPIIRQCRHGISASVIITSLLLPSSNPLKHSKLLQLATDASSSISSSTTDKHNSDIQPHCPSQLAMFSTGCCLIGQCYIRTKYFSIPLCPRKSVFVQTVPNTYLECIILLPKYILVYLSWNHKGPNFFFSQKDSV